MVQTAVSLAEQLRAALRTPGGAGGDLALVAATQGARPEDIAEALRDLTNPEALAIFNWLDNDRAAQVLGNLEPDTARYILHNAPPARIADLLDRLPMDDAAWVISEAEPDRASILLSQLQARAPQDAEEVRELLTYPEGTAGRLMTEQFLRLDAESTVGDAVTRVRQADKELETLTDLYVVEQEAGGLEKLVGVLSLRQLLYSRDEQIIRDVMVTEVVTVTVDNDQEEVAALFSKYDFLAMPVLDREGYLAGILTVDDIIDVLKEEQTEDQLRFSGISVEPGVANLPYFSTPIFKVVKSRVSWLILLFVAETATGFVLRHFENELAKVVALSFFIPLLIGTGGNTGAQTVSTIIRGLALKEIKFSDTRRVLLREIASGLLLGAFLGTIGGLRAMMWGSGWELSLVVALTLLAICTWANTIGSLIPLLAQRLKIDPALVSAPLITTLVDATGLVIYLSIARMLLTALR